ncbi:MAG: hypothetical protein ABJ360_18960 [Roseobacter sp.]
MNFKFSLFKFYVFITLSITACAVPNTHDREIREVQFSGFYNEISGELSDGTPVNGAAWFKGDHNGNFCLQADETVCSGQYKASIARRISGRFICNDGLTGDFVTDRVPAGGFVVPIHAEASMSDGRTALATFSELKQGSGTSRCFVQPR